MSVDLTAFASLIERAAREVHKSFPEFHDIDDTIQHMWLYLYENKGSIESIVRNSTDHDVMNKPVYDLLLRVGNSFLRKEDADWHHYTQDDTFFYSRELIEQILEVVFRHEEWQSFAMHYDKMPTGKSDPATAGNNVASYADVSRAVSLLSGEHYNAILWRYKYRYTYQAIGVELGLTKQGAQRRVNAALNALQRELGRKNLNDLRDLPEEHERPHGEGAQIRSDRYYEG